MTRKEELRKCKTFREINGRASEFLLELSYDIFFGNIPKEEINMFYSEFTEILKEKGWDKE